MRRRTLALAAALAAVTVGAGVAGGGLWRRHAQAEAVARGRAVATWAGCISCHGPALDGHKVSDEGMETVLYSTNLTLAAPRYTDAQLAAVLRTGRRPDGSGLWFMPAAGYPLLTSGEVRDLIVFIRAAPPTGAEHPRIRMGARMGAAVAAGVAKPEADDLPQLLRDAPPRLGDGVEEGRRLARIACAECHGTTLGGMTAGPDSTPDLSTAAAYTPAAFTRLLHEGVAQDGRRDLGWMTTAAKDRLHALDDRQIAAIHAYLKARAAQAEGR